MGFRERAGAFISHGWDAFVSKSPTDVPPATATAMATVSMGPGSSGGKNPSRRNLSYRTDKSIIAAIYTRISIDVASTPIFHVNLDDKGRYTGQRQSLINDCLTVEPNPDQGPTQFRQDIALSLCDEGVVALVPLVTVSDPELTGTDIKVIRVARIVEWREEYVKVSVWRIETQQFEELWFKKNAVAIIENPLYPIMNSRNSMLQRLVHKLNLLDAIDEQASSGKMDLIIQLPYSTRSETKEQAAEKRRKQLEDQMKDSKYGIGYIDVQEKITQLNRPAENNMLAQVEYLTRMVFSQLGLTPEVFEGTADETQMLNYHNRTVDPILVAIVEAMNRSFLTKTARTQGQAFRHFRDPFKYVPVSKFMDLVDKLARNAVLTANEIRQALGYVPVDDARAEKLSNPNMPDSKQAIAGQTPEPIELKQVPDQKPEQLALEQ